jgi:hypothetical protein
MTFIFQSQIPSNFIGEPVLISGEDSLALTNIEYLVSNERIVYEIRYEYKTSCFNDIKIFDGGLAIGHHEYFYLVDRASSEVLIKLKLSGYFGHMYYNDNLIYVADSSSLFCISMGGVVIWHTEGLAIDGVMINNFTNDTILGKGENDPPNGWEPFILDIKTGFKL